VLFTAFLSCISQTNKHTPGFAKKVLKLKKALNPEKALHFLFLAALIYRKNDLGRFTEHTHYHLSPCFPLPPPPPGAGVYSYWDFYFQISRHNFGKKSPNCLLKF
jgi:hypothetical protein